MSAYTDLRDLTITAGEQSAVAAIGYTGEDAAGVLDSCRKDLEIIRARLARITTNMGSTANKTKIDAWVTAALV